MTLVALLVVALAPGRVDAQDRRCRTSDCGPGTCFEERSSAFCVCAAGFVADNMTCAAEGVPTEPLRARRAPGITDRVVMIAQQEIGRAAYGVGRRRSEYPNALFDYVAHGDWWCSDFVSWVYRAAGVPFSGGYEEGGWMIRGNEAIQHWFEERDLWIARDSSEFAAFTPEPGDFIRFETRRGGHSGIVVRLDGDTLILIEGNFDNLVNRSRFTHYKSERSIAGFGVLSLQNAPPVAEAGEDQQVRIDEGANLDGRAHDDGPPELFDVTWSRIAGPRAVTFESAFSPATSVRFHEPGTYTLRLRASDGLTEVSDQVTITVVEPPAAEPLEALTEPLEAEQTHCGVASQREGWWLGALLLLFLARGRLWPAAPQDRPRR